MSRPGLRDLAEVLERLREEEKASPEARHERDRAVGRGLAEDADDGSLLLAWLSDRRGRRHHEPASPFLFGAAATLLALMAGWAAATAAFYFDGAGRVNVVVVLAVFVVLQGALLAAFALAALPASVSARIPLLASLARGAARLTPARLLADIGDLLPETARRRLSSMSGEARLHGQVLGEAVRWTLLAMSQWMALLFNAAAIATALSLVVFTDLAFGWATTLNASDGGFHAVTSALAAPWAALLPNAVPDLELVSGSRYFRLDGIEASAPEAARLGAWWPFLLACMIVYGLLPRVLTLAFARWRLRRALARTPGETPDLRDLLARMRTPVVATLAEEQEPAFTPPARALRTPPAASVTGALPQPVGLVNWSNVPLAAEELGQQVAGQVGSSPRAGLAAGGNLSLAEDRATIAALQGCASVALVGKAWEAPVLDLRDFLEDLRAEHPRLEVLVLPLAMTDGRPSAPRDADLEQWRHAVHALGDARMRVRPWQGDHYA